MNDFALINDNAKKDLFEVVADELGIRPDAAEKDFWICFMIDHLFNDSKFKDLFVFKGGTSLSKSYRVIDRFSEDIDLILDWRKVTRDNSDPWDDRSKTKQDQYNKQINAEAAYFYREELVPTLNKEIEEKLGKPDLLSIDVKDEMVVNFRYPLLFSTDYLRSAIRLEIGPLAEWTPSHVTEITPFVAEKYPDLFKKKVTQVLTVDVERTFWEKITILHKMANFPDGKTIPARYARHLYDVYSMGNSEIKNLAFLKKELLERDVVFKQKFYYSKGSHYETATLKTVMLIPKAEIIEDLRTDYTAMQNMIYGNKPSFDEILSYLARLEEEIHKLD